jgi:hypothetical protein
VPIPAGGHSVFTQHQSRDTETDESSGQSGALLEISYFTDEFAFRNILPYYFGTGEDDE